MAAEFDQRVRQLFDQAVERPESERLLFLSQECQGNDTLFRAVDRLLVAKSESDSFMNSAAKPARHIGRYIVHAELGRGGMGIVYDALDPAIGRNVAVKVINLRNFTEPSEAEFMRERLFREARSCGQLFHPGIVIIFDVGQEDEAAFIAMERVDGPTLQQLLRSGNRLAPNETLRILQQTAAALDYAHRNNIVHRDIKPANIMLRTDGTVKVADFGIAKVMSTQSATVTGIVMGTPSYMSPEQIEAKAIDGRSDQFSLAVVAYELFTGAKPFQADTLPAIAHQIVYGVRPSPSLADPTLPAAMDAVFQRAFSKDPADRFPTCADFTSALQIALQVPPPKTAEPAKPSSLPVKAFILAAALVGCLVAGVFFYNRNTTQAPVPVAAAEQPETTVISPVAGPSSASKLPDTPPTTIVPNTLPVIKSFRVDPPSFKTGTPATLLWEVTGADHITIDHGIGKVAPKGMFAVVPATSTTYSLTASAATGSTHRVVSVDVKPDPESVPPSVRARQFFTDAMAKRHAGQADEAATLFTRAAELGDTGAMVELGEIYSSGEGVTEDETKALNWFRRASEAGNVSGMVALGGMYLLGVSGGEPNEEEAAHWFQKAADRDSPAALYDLGTLYESGRGVTRNLIKAIDLYQKSAKLGNHEAQKRLAKLGTPLKN